MFVIFAAVYATAFVLAFITLNLLAIRDSRRARANAR